MKPSNFNPIKITVCFWMICAAAFVVVGLMGIKRWSGSKPLQETKHFVVNHDGRGYFFTSKEAADQFEFVAKLNEDGITQAHWQNSYLRLNRELRSENTLLKKRIDELESGNWVGKATNTIAYLGSWRVYDSPIGKDDHLKDGDHYPIIAPESFFTP